MRSRLISAEIISCRPRNSNCVSRQVDCSVTFAYQGHQKYTVIIVKCYKSKCILEFQISLFTKVYFDRLLKYPNYSWIKQNPDSYQ